MFCPSKNPQPIPALSQRYSVIEPPSCHFQSCNIYFAPLVAKRVRCKGLPAALQRKDLRTKNTRKPLGSSTPQAREVPELGTQAWV